MKEVIDFGKIEIKMIGIPFEKIERYRKIIHTLLEYNVFETRNGKIVLYFDSDGMAQIGSNKILWRKKKENT